MPCVYVSINKINGKKYIGANSNDNPMYFGSGKLIKQAINKYGSINFEKHILEICDLECLYDREKYWIDYFDAVNSSEYYNLCEGGKGGAGTLENDESIIAHRKGSKKGNDVVKKQRLGKTYEDIYGIERANIEREKRRNALLGKKFTKKRCNNISKSLKGNIPWNKGLTKETDERVKKYCKKRKRKPNTKYTIIAPNGKQIIILGRIKLKDYFKSVNENLQRLEKINLEKLLKNGERFGYKISKKLLKETID